MDADPKLRRWYRELNRHYFAGELPDVPLWWEPCADASAKTVVLNPDPLELGIMVDPFLFQAPRLVKLILCHEAAHVKLWPIRGLADHGHRFDQEIQRLCAFPAYRKLL